MRKKIYKILIGLCFFSLISVYRIDTMRSLASEITDTEVTQTDMAEQDMALLKYVIVACPELHVSEEQQILIGFNDENAEVSAGVLKIRNESDGETIIVHSSENKAGNLIFNFVHSEKQCGEYRTVSLSYQYQDMEYTVDFSEIGIDAVYGVETESTGEPDAVIIEENEDSENIEGSVAVTQIDENGSVLEVQPLEDVMESSDDNSANVYKAVSMGNQYIVVLDPGHDARHQGTSGKADGVTYYEYACNLKIAQYCKAALEQFSGIEVYLTREENGTSRLCPIVPDSTDKSECLKARVDYASEKNADYFISMHLNYNDNKSLNGAEVYYPNSNYNSQLHEDGSKFAESIVNQLAALGLKNIGIKTRTSSEQVYEDGSAADYYAVIRHSKNAGICGMIVEHCYMSNPDDLVNHCISDEKLKALGEADAKGIAEYLNLVPAGDPVLESDGYYYLSNDYMKITFTGMLVKEDGTRWYVENGKIRSDYSGLIYVNGTWCYLENGRHDTEFCGFVTYNGSDYYVKNGVIDWSYQDLYEENGVWYCIINAQLNNSYTGLVRKQSGEWWYVREGVPDETYSGLVEYNNQLFYVKNGYLDWGYSGIAESDENLYMIKNGKPDTEFTDLVLYQDDWYYIEKGKVNRDYTGLFQHSGGWYYVENGILNWEYSGLWNHNGVWYYIDHGYITWDSTCLTKYYSTWYYVENSKLRWDYTDLFLYQGDWYYVENGRVNYNYTGLFKHCGGWYYVENGILNWEYSGLWNHNGVWYYIDHGYINWKSTCLTKYYSTWYYVENSKLRWDFTDLFLYQGDWYYVENGRVNYNYTGLFQHSGGWYYVENGILNWEYSGRVMYNGTWYYVENGQINWEKSR